MNSCYTYYLCSSQLQILLAKEVGWSSNRRMRFDYGYDHQRIRVVTDRNMPPIHKTYIGNCERIDQLSKLTAYRTYLSGPLGVFAVVSQTGGEVDSVTYVLKDHLGSWTVFADEDGDLVREESFDAWGNRRNPATWTGPATGGLLFERGFTGHEHMEYTGLINMNGRLYDPVMSTFLSVDSYVQEPDFSQNFNRYAYCLNNPLKYTDPDGELVTELVVAMAISAAVNVVMSGINNTVYDRPFFEGAGKAAAIGALQGAFSYGIGAAAGLIGSAVKGVTNATWGMVAQAGFQVAAHGTLGGVSTWARGGSFWSGFASGAASSFVSSVAGIACHKAPVVWAKTAMIAAGGLSGGITSSMAGGDFWDGVCNGLICAGLNHAMHWVADGGVRLARFKMMTQDAYAKNPTKCKFFALAMAEYSLLGENARTPKQIEDAWNEIARTEKNESVRYQKVLAQNGIGIRDTQSTLNDIDGSEMYNIISSDNPVLVLSYYENFNGEYIRAHASLLIGVSDGNNSFEIADPMYTDTYYRTAGNMGRDPYNQRTTLYNKFYYFQLYKK